MIWLIFLFFSLNIANCMGTITNQTGDELVSVQIVGINIDENKIGLMQMKSFPLKFSYFATATEASGNHIRMILIT